MYNVSIKERKVDEMNVTIDLKTLGLIVLGIALLILIIYLIMLIRKAIDTLKRADVIIDDFQEVSGIASRRSKQIDKAADGVIDSVRGAASGFRSGGSSDGGFFSNLISFVTALKNLVSKVRGSDE